MNTQRSWINFPIGYEKELKETWEKLKREDPSLTLENEAAVAGMHLGLMMRFRDEEDGKSQSDFGSDSEELALFDDQLHPEILDLNP